MAEPGWLLLAAKIAIAVIVVVVASRATERAGPLLGAMIATLPVSTGPVYVFLAMDHGAAFVSESALMSLAGTSGIVAFVAAHALAAQRFTTLASLALATLAWFAVALALQARVWSFFEAGLLYAATFILAIFGLRRFAAVLHLAAARLNAAAALLIALAVAVGWNVAIPMVLLSRTRGRRR